MTLAKYNYSAVGAREPRHLTPPRKHTQKKKGRTRRGGKKHKKGSVASPAAAPSGDNTVNKIVDDDADPKVCELFSSTKSHPEPELSQEFSFPI